MIKITLSLILFFSSINIFSQSNLPEFGTPDIKELLLKDCDFEPGAVALKIIKSEKIEAVSNYIWSIHTEKTERIKVFNPSGYKYADIEIPYSKKNKIKNFSAYIYNINERGEILSSKIDKDDIFKKSEKKKKRGSLVFTFPGLKPGSVIEYRYTEVDKDPVYHDVKFFQDEIPVKKCVYKMIYPENLKTEITFPGGDDNLIETFEENQPSRHENTRTLSRQNIPSFREEPLMSSAKDNLQHMTIKFLYKNELEDSLKNNSPDYVNEQWNRICRKLFFNPFFGSQIAKHIIGTSTLVDSAKKIKDLKEKVDLIYKRVKNKIKWNNEEYIYAEDIDRAWQTEQGSNAEINLLIFNLLKKAGVECYLILVRSKEYGMANRYLFTLSQFNNVDVLVLDSTNFYVLDGTKKYLSFTTPPFEILNRDVLLADIFKTKWITLIDQRPLVKQLISVKAEIDSAGQISGNGFISLYDYLKEAHLLEKEEKMMGKAEEEKNFIKKNELDIKIDSLEEENPENETQPLNLRFSFTYKPELSSNFLFIDPFFLSSFQKNPFIDSIRRTDIDFGSNQYYSIYLNLTLPSNFTIEELPGTKTYIANDSSIIFKRQILRDNNIIVFKHSFEVKRTIFSKDEYLSLYDFFRKIYGAIKEQLILKRK